MKTVHFVMQGKGGAGKSFVANLIAQYIKQLNPNNLVLDTDPLNQSLFKMKGLGCEFINILNEEKDDINQNKFDEIFQRALTSEAEHIVIDTGSSSFLQLSTYIKKQNIITFLEDIGYKAKFHFVVNGGSEQNEAMKLTIEFANILYELEALNKGYYKDYKPLVLWLNPMPDKLKFDNANNSIIEDQIYLSLEYLIHVIVALPVYSQDGIVKSDIFSMVENLLTFDEFYKQEFDREKCNFSIIAKSRMKTYQKTVYDAIAPIFY